MINESKAPIFIVGAVRSGTTLLRLLLDHHPQINIFGEFEAAVSEVTEQGWPDIYEFYDFLEIHRQSQAYDFTVDRSLDYVGLVRSFFGQMVARTEKSIVGACIHTNIDAIPRIWPEARYIHLVRDPRDVAASCIGMGWVGNVFEGAGIWIEAEKRIERLKQRVDPEDVLNISFEQLISDNEVTLHKVCDFLGVPYSEEMLEIDKDTTYSKPNAKEASRWQDKLSKKQVFWVEDQCREMMSPRGYAALSGEGDDIGTIGRFLLKLDSRIRRIWMNINQWGLLTWILLVASRRTNSKTLQKKAQIRVNKVKELHLK